MVWFSHDVEGKGGQLVYERVRKMKVKALESQDIENPLLLG